MDSLAFFGIDAVPAQQVELYPVSLQSTTGEDRYAEIASLAIRLPSLPKMPAEMTGWSGVRHLFDLHVQASKWTAMKSDVQKKAAFVWKAAVQKNPTPFLEAVDMLHSMRNDGSSFCPLLWCWWRLTQQLEEGYSGLAFTSTWSAKAIGSKKMRRWFYEEVGADHISRRSVWPTEASDLLDMVKQFEREASKIASGSEQSSLWAERYARRYLAALATAKVNKESATARICERVAKYDLGIWLSFDVIDYLGLSQVNAQLVRQDLPTKPILRKKATR